MLRKHWHLSLQNWEGFSLAATDREKTGSVMCLKHEGGENHFAILRQKHMHTHSASCQHILTIHWSTKAALMNTLLREATVTLAPKCVLSPKQATAARKCGHASSSLELWEEIQTSKPFLPDPLYLPYSCWEGQKKRKEKERQTERGKRQGKVPWLWVESSVLTSASQRRGARALQFTFPVVRVCHLHSNVILVFLLFQWEQSSEHVVCYRIKPPDKS